MFPRVASSWTERRQCDWVDLRQRWFVVHDFAGCWDCRKSFLCGECGRRRGCERILARISFSYPLILLHGAFISRATHAVMMWDLHARVRERILGAAIQHFMPRVHTAAAPHGNNL